MYGREKPTLDMGHNFKFGNKPMRNERDSELQKIQRLRDNRNISAESYSEPRPFKLTQFDDERRRGESHRHTKPKERHESRQPTKPKSKQEFHEKKPAKDTSLFAEQHNKLNMNLLFGIHPVLLAIQAKRRTFKKLFVKNEPSARLGKIITAAQENNIPILSSKVENLDRLTGGRVHQGVCLRVTDLPIPKLEDAIRASDDNKLPLWLLLDQIYDPMNMGAIMRTAYFMGVDGIIGPKNGNCPLSPVVSKASSGVMEVVSYFHVDHVVPFLVKQRQQNWDIVGTVTENNHPTSNAKVFEIDDLELTRPTIVILGNEEKGMDYLREYCTASVTVSPGSQSIANVSSLNVSVAAGIILHNISQKLRKHRSSLH